MAVIFDAAIREETTDAARRLHMLIEGGRTPQAQYEKKCDSCSLLPLCMPKITGARRSIQKYMAKALLDIVPWLHWDGEMKTIPAIFDSKKIRRTLHNGEWWFAVSDVVEALTDSNNGSDTIEEMLQRDKELSKRWGQFFTSLLLDSPRGRQKVDCTDTAGVFRIVQSIASPEAEQFKCWLAKVGYERIQEFENPELATNLTKSLYLAKGYSETWIAKRLHGIAVRATLTDE
jgi:hypothetical protein